MVPGSATSVSPGNILEMLIHGSNPKVRESGTLGGGPTICILISLVVGTDVHSGLRTAGVELFFFHVGSIAGEVIHRLVL